MDYVTIDTVTRLQGENWQGNGDAMLYTILANSWLASRELPRFEIIPDAVLLAGSIVAKAIAQGEMLSGRSEGMIKAKSVTAGSVSTSKTYVDGEQGQAMSQAEQQALLLLAPYAVKPQVGVSIPLGRV